jgi:mannose-6-phosphate isomerase-like protein (cupin superfamily)
MNHAVTRVSELDFIERPYRPDDPVREVASLTTALALEQSRASVWRYPPGSRGRRHRELAQEEVIVVLEGAMTILVGDPAERVDLPTGSLLRAGVGEPFQLRNESGAPAVLLVWGAPPVTGQVEILDDLP